MVIFAWYSLENDFQRCFDSMQDGLFWDCSWIRGRQKDLPPNNLSHISYIDETWHSNTLPKKEPKNIWIMWHTHWVFLTSVGTSEFCYIKKYMYKLHFDKKFLILLTFLESLKTVFIKKLQFWWCQQKRLPQTFLKFWNEDYDVSNKILSRDSNYIVDVIMWPKFGNFSISMREVTIILTF